MARRSEREAVQRRVHDVGACAGGDLSRVEESRVDGGGVEIGHGDCGFGVQVRVVNGVRGEEGGGD